MLTFLVLATLGLIGGFTGLLFFAACMAAKEKRAERLERERRKEGARLRYERRWQMRGRFAQVEPERLHGVVVFFETWRAA